MKKICQNCQYWRDSLWCSNSQSRHYREEMFADASCAQFAQRGQKAPAAMRAAIKGLRMINEQARKKK